MSDSSPESKPSYTLQSLSGDVFGGITATVVALPIALAFGVASGMGAAAGLYCAIALGFFAAVFGGTPTQISGPTGPTTVAMTVIVTSHASTLSEALTVVIMGGVIQVLLGLSRIGRFVVYTPHAVISGFMSGIGIIIILIQTLPFLGLAPSPDGPIGSIRAWPDAIADMNVQAVVIASLTLAVGLLWPKPVEKFLPAPLVALVVGTLIAIFWLSDVPVIGEMPTALPSLHLELPTAAFLVRSVEPAIILALLGAVDSLLTALLADSITGKRHSPNRELIGQGIGNIVTGLIGGIFGSGSTTGTLTNTRAGAATRVSGMLYALCLVALLMGLGRFVEPIPLAVLAGILIRVALHIIDWRMLLRMHRLRPHHLVVMLLTLGLTVFVDLVTAVAIGLIAAGMSHARQLEQLELDNVVSVPLLDRTFFAGYEDQMSSNSFSARTGLVSMKGAFTVASSNKMMAVIGEDIKEHEVVIFDFSETSYIDDSAAMMIEELLDLAREQGTGSIVVGLSDDAALVLNGLNVLNKVPEDRVVTDLDKAREIAYELLNSS